MDMAMGISFLIVLIGCVVALVGLGWTVFDGRLWNNPGEVLIHWGMGLGMLGLTISLVAMIVGVVQCLLTNGCTIA